MDDFLKYFENKDFVQWVLNPNTELNAYWRKYTKDNPQEEEQIKKSRLIVLALKSKNTLQSDGQLDVIYSDILREINTQKKTTPVRKLFVTFLKYASVFLLFISISVFYYYYQKSNEIDQIANQLMEGVDQNNSQLILANGNKVRIDKKESEIEYGDNGEIVINKNDTLNYKDDANSKKEQYNQLIVPFGKKSSITLSDGTIAHINAGSRLIYPSTFIGSKREVFLYGEGFFEVSHNKNKPFLVKTNNQTIEVLGTKFNVSAYSTDKIVETVLAEGSVKLKSNNFSFFNDDYILKPNQKANYNIENKEFSVSKVDASKYVSWYLGYLNLETSELKTLVKRVERYYNINIKLENIDSASSKTITGKLLLKDNVETVMKVLASATGMELTKINELTYELK